MTAATVASAAAAGRRAGSRPPAYPRSRVAGVSNTAAGFVVALFLWGWVVMPLVHDGPAGVRDILRAKFFNKAPDGSWLP